MDFNEIILDLEKIVIEEIDTETNFFSVGGNGYLENPTSDLIALFMGQEPQAPRWLLKPLALCFADYGFIDHGLIEEVDWNTCNAVREFSGLGLKTNAPEDALKRIDIYVESSQIIFGIEHKINANATNNPFSAYDEILSLSADGRIILKCVLRPNEKSTDTPANWPVISYGNLLDKALDLYGREVAMQPLTKWSFFYRELLLHLKSLSNPEEESVMSIENEEFVISNFHQLKKAETLLQLFEKKLQESAASSIIKSLNRVNIDTPLTQKIHSWEDGQRALRFSPKIWGGVSDIVLVYYDSASEDLEESEDFKSSWKNGAAFYVTAYIDRSEAKYELEIIDGKFLNELKADNCLWHVLDDEDAIYYESRKNTLALSVWPKAHTKDGAVNALGDLALWIHKNAFT